MFLFKKKINPWSHLHIPTYVHEAPPLEPTVAHGDQLEFLEHLQYSQVMTSLIRSPARKASSKTVNTWKSTR